METLSSTEPHYIRCVKPNNVLKPAIFENLNVIQQLRCGVSTVRTFHNILFCSWVSTTEVLQLLRFWLLTHKFVLILLRVSWKLLESVVLVIQQSGRFMTFSIVLVFLLRMFWRESKFCSWYNLYRWNMPCIFPMYLMIPTFCAVMTTKLRAECFWIR